MKKENKVLKVIGNLDVGIACICMALLVIFTVAGVFWRRVLNAPFTWLEEVQLALQVWIVFAAAGVGFRYGNHVAIEIITDLFPEKSQKIITMIISVIVVFVLSYLFIQSIGYIQVFVKSGRATPMFAIPYKYIYGIAPLAIIDMVVSYFWALFHNVKSEAKEAVSNE